MVGRIVKKAIQKPLWTCPKCRKKFVTRNLWHSCGNFTVDQFFQGKSPHAKKLFQKFVALAKKCGPIIVNPSKTRISFQARTRFAGVSKASDEGLICGFLLTRRLESPRFTSIEFFPPRYYGHRFQINRMQDLNQEVLGWLKEAYKVGRQEHLQKKSQ